MRRSQTQKQNKHVLPTDVKNLKSTIEGMWKQITHGVSDPVKTKFEETLSYFDKMHAVRSKRTLTADEQGVYDRARKVIIARFEEMFNRAEPAVNARRNMKREREHGHNNNNNKHTARKSMHGGGDIWEMAMKFPLWVWDGLKAMIMGILSFFGSVFSEKQKQFMEHFSPSRLITMVGATSSNPDGAAVKLDGITAKLGASIERLQRTVVGGVSGAATASMDMILNAFSMMPGIGTTLLIWRMFQNLLVIIGASLSVQAGQVDGSNAISDAVNGGKADASIINAGAAKEMDVKATLEAGANADSDDGVSEEASKLIEEGVKPIPKDAFAVLSDGNGDRNPADPIVVVKIVAPSSADGKAYSVKSTAKDGAGPENKDRANLISEDELVLMAKNDNKKEKANLAIAAIKKVKESLPKVGGGKLTTANAVRASARALNQSLKRFSGMSTRVSSLLMKDSTKTKQQKTPKNPLSFLASTSAAASSSLISGYALKPLSMSRFIHA